ELYELGRDPPSSFSAGPIDRDTSYSRGIFYLDILVFLVRDYPFKPPEVYFCLYNFTTRIYHPNITDMRGFLEGPMVTSIPAITISRILSGICQLLRDPNPYCYLIPEISQLYKNDRNRYKATVSKWTHKYAK
ncbi:UBC-like protein, partial [Rhizophagus irregularis]